MKKFSIVVCLLFFTSACGGIPETVTPVLNTTVVPTTTVTPTTSVIPSTVEPMPSQAINMTFPDVEWEEIDLRALKGSTIDNEKLSILGGFMEKRTPETALRVSIRWNYESKEHCSVLRRGIAKSIRIDGAGLCVFYVQMHESAIDVNGAISDAAADVITPAITKMIMINDGLISVAKTDFLLNPPPPLSKTPTHDGVERPVEPPEKIFELLKVEKVWEAGFLGTGSVVAVFDRDGFATAHPAFEGKILEEVCIGDPGTDSYCSNGKKIEVGSGVASNHPGAAHGTQTAGVVSMLAPDAKYIFMTFSSKDTGSNAAHSLVYKWVADNAEKYDIDIFIMSMGARNLQRSERNLGYERFCSGGISNDPEVPDPIASFSSMRMKGVIPVVAAGNDGYLDLINRPACLEDAISVGAVNGLGEIEDYSNVGQDLTFLAPVNLPAPTLSEFESSPFSGTSAAAPVVAAMMAIGRQIKPDSTVDELVELGRATGKSIDDYVIKDLKLIDFFAFSQALSTGSETTTAAAAAAAQPTPTTTQPTSTHRISESEDNHQLPEIFELLKVEKVWEAGFLGTGSVVAVFDRDGFATTHPAFEGKILEEVCIGDPGTDSYCSNGKEIEVGSGVALNRPGAAHGTQTAGVVSMLAPDAKYIFMTFSSKDIGSNLAHSLAYKWVADNAEKYDIDIFIMSMNASHFQRSERNLGYERFCSGGTSNDPEVPDPIASFSSMRMKGVIPVIAAGNDSYLDLINRPACLEDAISVGAVNGMGKIEDYSNVGQDLTFLAPVNLPAPTLPEFESELFNNHPFNGTSAAAPVVAAMMAIGRQIKPDSTVDELVELGRATGKSIDDYLIKDLKLIDFFAFSQALSTEE